MISTSTLERIACACQMLHQAAEDLKEHDADLMVRVCSIIGELKAVRAESGRRAFGPTFVSR